MKPLDLETEKALQTIDAVCSTFKGNRQDHAEIIKSIDLIRKKLEEQIYEVKS